MQKSILVQQQSQQLQHSLERLHIPDKLNLITDLKNITKTINNFMDGAIK